MTLAPWASDPADSRGRRYPESDQTVRGPRDAFQRDRDRIIHSISFRRLRHKTQVFIAPDGDHFRVRLTHSLEVAQIGRTVARALALNEDLTEAICLAHDIGHPPFGHAGEDALKAALGPAGADVGGFDHNGHTLRVLTEIERPYPIWDGLNLTWECLEGLAKHNGPVRHPGWAVRAANDAYPLALASCPSLEAQVAAIADDVAYDNHDIDDGLRAGILSLDQLMAVPLVARGWAAVRARYPAVATERLARELVRAQIGVMVDDLLGETRARIAAAKVDGPDAVRTMPYALVGFTAAMREDERDLKRFMYAQLYHHPHQLAAAQAARVVVAGLFAAFQADPSLMGKGWDVVPSEEPWRSRRVADYIAGMTDRYAVAEYRRVVGPIDMPDGI